MRKQRWCGALLALALVLTLLPTAAFAEDDTDKVIQLGTGDISGYADTGSYDYIYYGTWNNNPIKWRVLDTKTNMDKATAGDGFFLLSDALFGTGSWGDVHFNEANQYNTAWQGSNAQSWCNNFYNTNLTPQEQNSILATTKSDEAFTSSTNNLSFVASTNILNEDRIFFLSAAEAENKDYGFVDDAARVANYGTKKSFWWLRSPYVDGSRAGMVQVTGDVQGFPLNSTGAARPAFNLNTDSVLFASAAEGGKADVAVDNSLTAVEHYTDNEWKLTLKDTGRRFSADANGQASFSAQVGDSIQIAYSGAQTGENEYISAMLIASDNTVLYYGRIANNSASGTASVTIPDGLDAGSYTLKVFSEQCNGDKKTDYASAFQNISLAVKPNTYSITYELNGGTNHADNPSTYTYGTGVSELYAPTKSGYRFGGWYTTEDFSGDAVTEIAAGSTENVTLYAKWTRVSSGSYTPSYAASVSETEHGSVSVSPRTAAAGTTVTVTVTPDQGYTLETLTVTDASGKELPLTDQGDGRFTFTQPASKVTVRATFMDDNTMLNFFADVKASDYYYDAVLWAAQKGITSGTDAVHFSPNQPCTRAQIVTFLWRAAGSPVVNYAMSMTDVPADAYYAEAVRWALSLGVTTGTGAGAFSPDASCTRAQAVTFLARAQNAKASGKAAFSDVPSGSYYADAVAWATESGVTTGTSADAFSPDDVCTRAQIVTFLYRAFQ